MSATEEEISKLKALIDSHQRIVFFGGAGVSTESGIPDFRSAKGIYSEKYHNLSPETIISHEFFMKETELFYEFYREKMLFLDKDPNPCHTYLAKLEEEGKLDSVVTQNIDGLHQKAGSKKVYELHGSVHRNHCMKCHKFFDSKYIAESKTTIPYCDECGGIIKPDVVLYNEGLDDKTVDGAINALYHADLLIIAGTSLAVYPAASFIRFYQGHDLVYIDIHESDNDRIATLPIHEKVGVLFSKL